MELYRATAGMINLYFRASAEVKHKKTFWQAEMGRMEQEVLQSRELLPTKCVHTAVGLPPIKEAGKGVPHWVRPDLDFRCTFQF